MNTRIKAAVMAATMLGFTGAFATGTAWAEDRDRYRAGISYVSGGHFYGHRDHGYHRGHHKRHYKWRHKRHHKGRHYRGHHRGHHKWRHHRHGPRFGHHRSRHHGRYYDGPRYRIYLDYFSH